MKPCESCGSIYVIYESDGAVICTHCGHLIKESNWNNDHGSNEETHGEEQDD